MKAIVGRAAHVALPILLLLQFNKFVYAVTYQYILFGDSLTDTGNVFQESGIPDPAIYYKGRFTNGPNWVDYLNATLSSKHTVQIFNYAYGAGVACPRYLNTTKFPYGRDSANQTATFLADLARGKILTGKDTRHISISWFAANDMSVGMEQALMGGRSMAAAGAEIVSNLVSCLTQHVAALAAAGVHEVVLIPQSPVQTSPLVPPAFRAFVAQLVGSVDVALVQAVAAVNAQLEAAPPGSPASRAHVYLLGDSKWMARLLPAIQPPFKYTTGVQCLTNPDAMALTATVRVCDRPNDYAFYDHLHPTTLYHRWFALNALLPRLQLFRLAPRDV
ncbi:hypothetical protein HXX76_005836 [Chlamydomonas incerta]|uniref:Uncharacterized protein n=1 Tax=Chlamydomonas incerta TaxID=51695 RepID=A0A835W1J9_CHLIN|nr:hypothetical protein HXX76_005836 [Chlamydomonas incerta]|eukprot:KAG2437172.1 hypothetical protein HXX76_005836 [Chlamydomonas incerta]